ncbi:MAG: hypothetical protein K8R53_11290 [Bacteroidales bacterium]|nr:hypothetical protein [Bacteroidales bacterium]
MKDLVLHIIIFSGFTLLLSVTGFSQKTTKVKLIRANDLIYDKALGENVQRLIGNVILKHDSTFLYCDSAYLDEGTNSFDGFGNVRIKVSDTLNIYSHLLHYNGNTKIAELIDSVKMVDREATLTTDKLWYSRITEIAWYITGGKIVDDQNELTSKKGYYYTGSEDAYFRDSVVLVNPDYIMNSDTLRYNTTSEISYFFGPTTIISDDNFIYCEWGWYNTQSNKSRIAKNAYIITEEQKLEGDTLYYDRTIDFGIAKQNVIMTDTVQNVMIMGEYGEFFKKRGYAFVVDSAVAVFIDKHDSLFLHSDTLRIEYDTVEQKATRMLAYYKAKFYRKDMQGMCDSLIYDFTDSTIFLYNDPVLWSEKNQLTADTINIAIADNQVDTLALKGSSFIISADDSIAETYNQIKGKTVIGYFRDNEIVKVKVHGNSETIYFIREDNGELIGINKTVATDMLIFLEKNEFQTITYIRQPKGAVYPEDELSRPELFLKNFKWLDDRRPYKKSDIFIW